MEIWHGLQESNLPSTVLETGMLPKHLARKLVPTAGIDPA